MIGDAVLASLPALRAQAESTLVDSCELQRPTAPTTDPETGYSTPGWESYWSGACRLVTNARIGLGTQDVAGAMVSTSDLTLSIPVSASTPSVGHRVLMASGTVLYVTGGTLGSMQVLQRIPVSREVVADRA